MVRTNRRAFLYTWQVGKQQNNNHVSCSHVPSHSGELEGRTVESGLERMTRQHRPEESEVVKSAYILICYSSLQPHRSVTSAIATQERGLKKTVWVAICDSRVMYFSFDDSVSHYKYMKST